ncbi:MAG: hypothetical protein ABW186_18285 [Rhodanobacteraceae bacterium]
MEKVAVDHDEVLASGILSPERWLARSTLQASAAGVALSRIASATKRGRVGDPGRAVVLDTAHAVAGLLRLPDPRTGDVRPRVSHKKFVPEGSVIVSRLRPYLRQVAYVPTGSLAIIGERDIVCSTEFYVLTPNGDESIAFLVPWLLSAAVQQIFAKATTGGHHPRFDEALLWSLRVPHAVWRARTSLSRAVEEATVAALRAQRSLDALVDAC